MRRDNLLSAAALIVALVLVPDTASAQRGGGRHHGRHRGHSEAAGPVVIVGQPVTVRSTFDRPDVPARPSAVREPSIAGSMRRGDPPRIGFGSIPVRTGFGTQPPVRTGFENAPVRTGFGVRPPFAPVPVTIEPRHAAGSKRIRGAKRSRVKTIVVGYPVPYLYCCPQYGATSSPSYYPTPPGYRSGVQGGIGVSAGPSTYWMDLANEPGATGGLFFSVAPADAQVSIDGVYAGTVLDFSSGRPLMVIPGRHYIELRAPGYRTVALDVTVAAGQVIPYEGELERLRP